MSYTPLSVQTEYTLPYGSMSISRYIERLKEIGAPAAAITDKNVLYGAHEFYEQATKAGIKPIIGLQVTVDYGQLTKGREWSGELTLIAQNETGYKNLIKLSAHAFFSMDKTSKEPTVDTELLEKCSAGLFALSGGTSGVLGQAMLSHDKDATRASLKLHQKIFKRRYLLELQSHGEIGQSTLNEYLLKLSSRSSLIAVASPGALFAYPEDKEARELMHALAEGRDMQDPARTDVDDSRYIKSVSEMKDFFSENPEVVEATNKLAQSVELDLTRSQYHVPQYPLPEGVTSEEEYLRKLVYKGAVDRYGKDLSSEVKERIEHELGVISKRKFPGYFLLVQEMTTWARNNDMPVGPGRGSAAGSIVSYCLRITDLDPIEHQLLFERFLNPDRTTMPDIDVDFEPSGRSKVFEHLQDVYGEKSVAQIITFGRLQTKALIRRVMPAYGILPATVDHLARSVEKANSLEEALEESLELRLFFEEEAVDRQRILAAMRALEGVAFNESTHASGVIVAPRAVEHFIPVIPAPSDRGREGQKTRTSQYDMTSVEKLGLLKIDVLGLNFLTVLKDATSAIHEDLGVDVSVEGSHLIIKDEAGEVSRKHFDEDKNTFELLSKGNTLGLFQIERSFVAKYLRDMQPESFKDVTAALALIRPGPLRSGMAAEFVKRKKNPSMVKYLVPELETVLKDTYGVLVYQEQIMLAATKVAGFSPSEADELRKAVSKKDEGLIASALEKFVAGGLEQGHPEDLMQELADQIRTFGQYGFNRSHSAAYAQLVYFSAHLKANYPAHYLASRMSAEASTSTIGSYVEECRQLGLKVLKPDINESQSRFSAGKEGSAWTVLFGLSSVHGIGEKLGEKIVLEREENGPFASPLEFAVRMRESHLTKSHMEALAFAGAFDEFGSRSAIAEDSENVLRKSKLWESSYSPSPGLKERKGIVPAEEGADYSAPEKLPVTEILAKEKKLLGAFVSTLPTSEYSHMRHVLRSPLLSELKDEVESSKKKDFSKRVELIGMVGEFKKTKTKAGSEMAHITLQDESGIEVRGVIFSNFLDNLDPKEPEPGSIIQVIGVAETYNGEISLKIFEASRPQARLDINAKGLTKEQKEELWETLKSSEGKSSVFIDGKQVATTDIKNALLERVASIVGSGNIKMTSSGNSKKQQNSASRSSRK